MPTDTPPGFWARLWEPFHRWRYALLSRHLGIPENLLLGQERGFILVQIDGLSFHLLRRAMAKGNAPFLRKLVSRRGYRFQPLFLGMPTSTPAVQFGVFHGENFGIPAFRWFEKHERVYIDFSSPLSAGWVEERMASRVRPGLLTYGTCYTSLITGGAHRAVFTTSAFSKYRLFCGLRQLDLLWTGLLSPYFVMATLFQSAREWWRELKLRWHVYRRTGRFPYKDYYFPLMRVIAHVIFRLWSTLGVRVDIYRSVPAIYVNFIGVDDVGHHHGARHPHLWAIIHDIDRSIRQIYEAKLWKGHRKYDLFIMSDHGSAPAIPFEDAYGQTLEQFVRELAGPGVTALPPQPESANLITALLGELTAMESRARRYYRPMLRRARHYLTTHLERERAHLDLEHLGEMTLTFSSASASLYFHVTPERLKLTEIAALYPRLIPGLLEHPGIGGLLVLTDDGPRLLTRDASVPLADASIRPRRYPKMFKDRQEHAEYLAQQLSYMGTMPNVGDVVIFGAYLPDSKVVVNFDGHLGTHGAYEGEQTDAFMITPPHVGWDLSHVSNSRDLYPYFWNGYASAWHLGQTTAARPVAPAPPARIPDHG